MKLGGEEGRSGGGAIILSYLLFVQLPSRAHQQTPFRNATIFETFGTTSSALYTTLHFSTFTYPAAAMAEGLH